jgi:multiple sugar transport system ATP-binding protein
VLETLGAEDTAYLDLGGTTIVASLDPDSRVAMGSTAKFVVNLSKVHVFDHDTEQAIR